MTIFPGRLNLTFGRVDYLKLPCESPVIVIFSASGLGVGGSKPLPGTNKFRSYSRDLRIPSTVCLEPLAGMRSVRLLAYFQRRCLTNPRMGRSPRKNLLPAPVSLTTCWEKAKWHLEPSIWARHPTLRRGVALRFESEREQLAKAVNALFAGGQETHLALCAMRTVGDLNRSS